MKIFNIKINKTRAVFLLLGIILLFLLFKNFGIKQFLHDIRLLGWRFIIIVLLFLFNNISLSLSWKILINYRIKWNKFYKLILARIVGDSTSSINAMASIAGEPLKALFIKNIVPFKTGLASVILDRTVHTLANTLSILTGIVFSFFVLNLSRLLLFGFLLFITATLFTVIYIIKKQKQGFIAFIIEKLPQRLTARFKNKEMLKKINEIDKDIALILSSRKNLKKFYISLAIKYISIFSTGTMEVFLILNFIDVDISAINSMFVYIFSLFLTSLFFFIPANMGTSEASNSYALNFLGFNPALGLTIGLIKRLRTFVWSGIGMLIMFYGSVKKKKDIFNE